MTVRYADDRRLDGGDLHAHTKRPDPLLVDPRWRPFLISCRASTESYYIPGMSRRALIALLSLTCCSAGTGNADTLESSLLPWLGIDHSGARTSLSDPWQPLPMPSILVAFDDEDLLRRYVDGARTADLSTRQVRMTAILPFPGAANQWLQVETAAGGGGFSGQGRGRDWSGALATDRSVGGLAYRRHGSSHRLTAGLRWGRERGGDQAVNLYDFHTSATDSRMNRYFWDLLEPTLGDELTYTWDQESLGVDMGWSIELDEHHRLGVQGSWRRRTPNAVIDHVNDGSRQELRGPRRTDVDQDTRENRLVIGVEQRLGSATRLRGEAGFTARHASSLARQRDVPRSDSGVLLDIIELGRGRADQRGADVSLRGTRDVSAHLRYEGAITWARSELTAEGVGSTPVLGYSLRTLPISHGGTFSLTGDLTTWAVDTGVELRCRTFGAALSGLALRSRYRGHTTADAQMEFGLIVTPVDRVAAYDLHLFRLALAPWLRLPSSMELEYEITQYAGRLRDRDADPDPQASASTHRGGRIHSLRFRLYL